ncbi:MAG: UbiD family decarboxylase [Chloroflexi bacterium]|nr:UbiD family decarboxylase [Chloroflexota bacterium]
MGHASLGSFFDAAAAGGDVQVLEGADPHLEVGCLVELNAQTNGPLLVFDRFQGFPPGYRVATNVLVSPRRCALALGFDLEAHPMEWVRAWRAKRQTLRPVAPRMVATGPALANQQPEGAVDVTRFPVPTWHERDAGPYIGTGDVVVTRHPTQDWVNAGIYRASVLGPDLLTIWIGFNKQGHFIAEEYWKRGQVCPVAVVLGCDPLTWLAAGSPVPFGQSEYDYAGALHGAPLRVVTAPLTGLPVPAEAEIVLEGEIPPPHEQSAMEGPFGEWPGYYAHQGKEAVVRVKRVSYRDDPILHGAPPLKPTIGVNVGLPRFAAELWDHLERSGISDVAGVWGFCNQLMIVIALRQRFAGYARQALQAACGYRATGSMYRYYVAVDEDVDPTDLNDVLWALCTRVDPASSIDVVRSWTTELDPMVSPEKQASGDYTMGRMLIDACKPFHWRDRFPASNVASPELRRAVAEKWSGVLQNLR